MLENGASLGVAIREMRKAAKISQLKLAEDCGVSGGYISQIESGYATNPSDSIIECFAEKTNGDPITLFELRDGAIQDPEVLSEQINSDLKRIGFLLGRVEKNLQTLACLES